MFSALYNCALFLLGIFALPKILWQWMVLGKYRASFAERLGFCLPPLSQKKGTDILWIHAVSLGETRAVIPLYTLLRAHFPHTAIVISSTTETGHAEARRSMPDAACHFFLPLDFSFLVRKVVRHFRPRTLLLVESDFWYHLIREVRLQGGEVFLVNGKVSERSMRRFCQFSSFTRRLFSHFQHLCVQSPTYQERFVRMGVPKEKITVTGNLKFDAAPPSVSDEEKAEWRKELGLLPTDQVLVIGSTHEPEEDLILSALDTLIHQIPTLKILLVPRHPERFATVAEHLRARHITTFSYSQRTLKRGGERVILIDAMGLLTRCYALATAAIVGGSFIRGIGGHNVFEPVSQGIPVLFGPHMQGQPDLVSLVLQGHAGLQVPLEKLPEALLPLLTQPTHHARYQSACQELASQVRGSAARTLDILLRHSLSS